MAAIAGKGGQARVGANVVADVQEWSADIEKDLAESTALGASWKSNIPTLKGGSGSLSMSFNLTDTNGQKALQDSFFNDTTVTLNLDTAASGTLRTYSGAAWVTKLSPGVKVSDRVMFSIDFTFDGAVTFA